MISAICCARRAAEAEFQFLVDRISTNHTHFFRKKSTFRFPARGHLPEMAVGKPAARTLSHLERSQLQRRGALFTTIHLAEHFAPAESGRWEIEGTDISTRVLEIAQRGICEAGKLDRVSADILRRHFQRGVNQWAGHLRLKNELRGRVNFQHLNLLDGSYPFAQMFDLIFCRNVMIYFDRPTQETLVRQLAGKLARLAATCWWATQRKFERGETFPETGAPGGLP